MRIRSFLAALLVAFIVCQASTPASAQVASARISGAITSGDCYRASSDLGGSIKDVGSPCKTYVDNGTKFTLGTGTGACATTSLLTGGAIVGSFKCTGTGGASTQVINLPTATTGWVCHFQDSTTTADAVLESANSTTSATVSGTIAANDVIVFSCSGY